MTVSTHTSTNAWVLMANQRYVLAAATDRRFAWLMVFQWLAGVMAALLISPRSWEGSRVSVHVHVWAALLLGGVIAALPVFLALKSPGRSATRQVIAVAQILMGALLIHLTGGRIETHFHVFGSLAFLAMYRDWRVLVTASAVVTVDHLLRGMFWPESVYGVLSASVLRSVEHAGWVVFEDIFLVLGIRHSLDEMRRVAGQQAELEGLNAGIEAQIVERTAALRSSEGRYRALVESSPTGIFVNFEDRFAYVNQVFCQIVGARGPEDLLGTNVFDRFGPEFHGAIRERTSRALETGEPAALMDQRYVRLDGASVEVETMDTLTSFQDKRAIQVVVNDITARKQASEALREVQVKYRSIFDNAVEGILQTCPGGHLITANPALARMLGYASAEALLALSPAMDSEVCVHPSDWADFLGLIEKNSVSNGFRCQFKRRDGRVIWVSLNGRTALDAAGGVRFYDVTCEDITEGRRLEEQLRQSQKMEAVGQLAGGIAHDFNNMLGVIIGNAELARMDPELSRDTTECLESIMKASGRGADLVNQILAFSRRQEPQRESIQLQVVLREVLKLIRSTVPSTIEFKVHFDDTRAVLADASQVHQVVMNLCTNASHAMGSRPGVLRVELREIEVDADFARLHTDLPPGHYARVTLADNGCGMDSATMARIYEPFFTTKPTGEGSGLGLSVVHGIMKSHEGCITVYSQLGEGTTFHLYFPLVETASTAPPAQAAPVPRGAGQRILFVDDEEPLASLGKSILERLGYRVTVDTSATSAAAVFRDQPDGFDLVITDFSMPGMNGVRLARTLLDLRPALKVILTTGYSATLTSEVAREMGFCDLLLKPNTVRSLGESVHRALGSIER